MLGDVVEGFLKDAVDDDLGFGGNRPFKSSTSKDSSTAKYFLTPSARYFKAASNPRSSRMEGLRSLDRRRDVVDDLVQVLEQFQTLLLQVRLVARPQLLFDGPGAELHNRQALPQLIVQLQGETLPFMLLGLQELGTQVSQAPFRFLHGHLGPLGFRGIEEDAAERLHPPSALKIIWPRSWIQRVRSSLVRMRNSR